MPLQGHAPALSQRERENKYLGPCNKHSIGTNSTVTRLALVSFQRIVERLSRSDYRRFVCNRDCQDANSFVVRQHQSARACRQVDHVSKQIRVSVRFSAAISGMTMR